MYKIIHSFARYGSESPGSYSVPSVVEDVDGYRILVTADETVHSYIQSKLDHYGVVMQIVESPHVFIIDGVSVPCVGYPTFLEATSMMPQKQISDFVHLHTHSEFSSLDGLSKIDEIVAHAVEHGQRAIAVTDHGTCASHPHLQAACKEAGITPIFGLEAYFVDDRHSRPPTKQPGMTAEEIEAVKEQQKLGREYWHLVLWAIDDVGLKNLWAMSTEANRDGLYYHPRLDWDTLQRFSEGVACSTACLHGPVATALVDRDGKPIEGGEEVAFNRLARLQGIFGDRCYVEIHTNQLDKQMYVNLKSAELAESLGVKPIAVVDSHYACEGHKEAHQVWVASQTNRTLSEDSDLFSDDEDYHLRGEEEVRKNLSYLPSDLVDRCIANTGLLADQCTARLSGDPTPPLFLGSAREDSDLLIEVCVKNLERKCANKSKPMSEYNDRLVRELNLLVSKGLCGYFNIVAEYCLWAKRQGILVGPGRGSGGASLVAYLSGIIEIDPVDAELPFERFLTPGRTELPDFDIDFPSERLDEVMDHVVERYGDKSVVRVGTHIRLKSKGIIRNLARILAGSVETDYLDIEEISKIIERAEAGTAGLGLTWEELWEQNGEELDPYRQKYPKLFELADIMVGRLKSYGKHAAGVVIANGENLTDNLPLRYADGMMVAEFDKDALAELGLVKFDFLGLRNLDTLQRCVDLVRENTGVEIDLYDWREEYESEEVWKFLSEGSTLGCFQIETQAGTHMTRAVQPTNLHDLADVITLDRPGPMRSGLDRLYLDRRFGRKAVRFADPRLEQVLHRTYGVMLYQEDIMGICRALAGYDEEGADYVRKILGKKKVAAAKAEGAKFIPACVNGGLSIEAAETIWKQMEEFSRYSFNKAHAYGYGMLAYWCAWFSYYYPAEFYVAAMSTVDADRIPDFVFGAKTRGLSVLPPDINASGKGFSAQGTVVRFGLDAIKGVGEKAVEQIVQNQPYESFDQFMENRPNMGVVKTLVRAGCFDSMVPNRKALEARVAQYENKEDARCVHWNPDRQDAPKGLPCDFDWASEPIRLGKKGQPIKALPIPAKCTVRCRHYEKRSSLRDLEVAPYTDAEIRQIETELFGVYLSSTPFDVIDEDVRIKLGTGAHLGGPIGTEGHFAAIVLSVTQKVDKNGNKFAFVDFQLPDGKVRCACWNEVWRGVKSRLEVNQLVLAKIRKMDEDRFSILEVHNVAGWN